MGERRALHPNENLGIPSHRYWTVDIEGFTSNGTRVPVVSYVDGVYGLDEVIRVYRQLNPDVERIRTIITF